MIINEEGEAMRDIMYKDIMIQDLKAEIENLRQVVFKKQNEKSNNESYQRQPLAVRSHFLNKISIS